MSHAVPTAVTPHSTAAPERPLRVRVAAVYAVVVALHVLAAALLLGGYGGASPSPVLLAALVTAYGAGLKHSYDWDHISAIDNSTRKFVSEGGSPAGVGLAFSLGHSLVVTLAATAIAEAKETGAPVPLRPMNPFERKVVHDVAKREGLRSESDGDGKGRHVVIYPAS